MTDFTRKQGETFRFTIMLEDTSGYPIKLAEDTSTPLYYFRGFLTDGTTEVEFTFEYKPSETITTGLGDGLVTSTGIFKLICYISADAMSGLTTGDWTYAIRISETVDPATLDDVRIIQEGTLTLEASKETITGSTAYSAPTI